MVALDLGNYPLPERKCLRVRIVHTKDRDACADPVKKDALQLLPHARPVVTLKIEWINILILLWRILGVLNGSIGTLLEPVLMFGNVRMIRRCLERNIERHGKIQFLRTVHKVLEVL